MSKTRSDLQFEAYLKQRGVADFDIEPYRDGGKNPDYRFTVNGVRVLVEVEEIDRMPLDELHDRTMASPTPIGVMSFDLRDSLDPLRAKIDAASRQLKPRASDADNCIVIIGKKRPEGPSEIDQFYLTYAMYGDLAYTVPLPEANEPHRELELYVVPNGSVRKYDRQRGGMVAQHSYVSAVGTVIEYSPYSVYQEEFFTNFCRTFDPGLTLEQKFMAAEQAWTEHEPSIPEHAKDPQAIRYRLVLVENVNSVKPLSKDAFGSSSDDLYSFEGLKIPRGVSL